jgi:Zn-dependent protease
MFGKSIKIFKLLGFQVKIDISWLILAILISWSLARGYFPFRYENLSLSTYWIMGVIGTLGLFLSIILHELGHSVVSRKQGIPMKGITLFIFGGVAEMNEEPPDAHSEFVMAIIGPAISVALGIGFYLIYFIGKQIELPILALGIFNYLGWINLLLAVFNMLPAFPLDGGRVLRSFLWKRKGSLRKATRSASRIGSGFGALLIALGVLSVLFGSFISGMWWFLIGLFLRNAARASYVQLEIRQALQGEPIGSFMNSNPITVQSNLSIEELVNEYILRHHFHMFPVVQNSKILGSISTQEVKKIPKEEWSQRSVNEILIPCGEENKVGPDTDALEVLSILRRAGRSRLMVMDGDRLAGVVSLKDLLKFLSLKLDLEGDSAEEIVQRQRQLSCI